MSPSLYELKNTDILGVLLATRQMQGRTFYLCKQVKPRITHGQAYLFYRRERWTRFATFPNQAKKSVSIDNEITKTTEIDSPRTQKKPTEIDLYPVPVSAYYGPEWRRIRAIILTRDNFTCQRCGATERSCGKRLHIHHIIAKEHAASILEANDPDNLITLCHFCHRAVQHQDHTNANTIRMTTPLYWSESEP